MSTMKRFLVVVGVAVVTAGVAGCASREPAAPAAPAAAAVSAPASSPMSQITPGMSDVDVRKILGEPTRTRSYQTGKAFIPWYVGSDTARTAYTYAGQGEVVFSNSRYSGGLSVVRVDYNPSVQ
jgi:outer membrane protein assembly factor BamE (lipoprotein component of BamABCDE complex)